MSVNCWKQMIQFDKLKDFGMHPALENDNMIFVNRKD